MSLQSESGNLPYRGRFAPTPSGPLHLGSLLTALASYLEAKRQGGSWLLRIDDLDTQRNRPGMCAVILKQLEAHALHWDESPRYQSRHLDDYEKALQRLITLRCVYVCNCTRSQLKRASLPGPDDAIYAGSCRDRQLPLHGSSAHALRMKTPAGILCYEDAWLGRQCREAPSQIGDFTLRRSDGQFAYQLACGIDETAQSITEVVRGADLLGSTFRQLIVQQALGLAHASYRHLPVLVDASGRKLSKQNRATALDSSCASSNVLRCLQLLNQSPPRELTGAPIGELIAWATQHWHPENVPRQLSIPLE